MIQVTSVILCGGFGIRLWHLSRTGFPKQFLCLTSNESLFQQVAQRLAALGSEDIQVADLVVVRGEDHLFLASEQLREVGIVLGEALLEPMGRNTLPALTLAALTAVQNGQDPVLVVTLAGQTIAKPVAFTAVVQQAIAEAEQDNIVILVVTPDKSETSYGFIHTASSGNLPLQANVYNVQAFVDKPSLPTAQRYLSEGGYYWNAGMFVLKASVWLKAIEQFAPAILQATCAAWDARKTDDTFVRPGQPEKEKAWKKPPPWPSSVATKPRASRRAIWWSKSNHATSAPLRLKPCWATPSKPKWAGHQKLLCNKCVQKWSPQI